MKKLLLIHHGETDWNIEHRLQGQYDVPLNENGTEQARRLAHRLKDAQIDAIYSSDLAQCYETAKLINKHHLLHIHKDDRLREFNLGKFQGLTPDEVKGRYPQDFDAWRHNTTLATHGGETVAQMSARIKAVLDQITHVREEKSVAVVSHGGALRVLICLALKISGAKYWRFHLGNASISELQMNQTSWTLNRLSDIGHLEYPSE